MVEFDSKNDDPQVRNPAIGDFSKKLADSTGPRIEPGSTPYSLSGAAFSGLLGANTANNKPKPAEAK